MNRQHEKSNTRNSQASEIVDYIARGIDHGCGECIGLELEHFVVHKGDHAPVFYLDDPVTGELGVRGILEKLSPLYDESTFEPQPDGTRNLIGLAREYATITLEPGAQLEISIGPVLEVRDLEIVYGRFREELDPILDGLGYELLSIGYHPTACVHEIPLIPKERYRFMDRHFETTGAHGICMMRGTSSTQISIDFKSEEDAVVKFRIANALSPLLAFLTDNSPVFEGEPLGSMREPRSGLSLPRRMVRTVIWDDVDAMRSMTAPGTFDGDFGFHSYAESVLNAPAIFTVSRDSEGNRTNVWQGTRSFAEALDGLALDRETIEHILSLFFYDVRFKTYIEIRAADSLPIGLALSFAALIKGLFYREENVNELASRFNNIRSEDIVYAKVALRENGYDASVYRRPASEWLDGLLILAGNGLSDFERPYLGPLADLVASRRTPVDTPKE